MALRQAKMDPGSRAGMTGGDVGACVDRRGCRQSVRAGRPGPRAGTHGAAASEDGSRLEGRDDRLRMSQKSKTPGGLSAPGALLETIQYRRQFSEILEKVKQLSLHDAPRANIAGYVMSSSCDFQNQVLSGFSPPRADRARASATATVSPASHGFLAARPESLGRLGRLGIRRRVVRAPSPAWPGS